MRHYAITEILNECTSSDNRNEIPTVIADFQSSGPASERRE